MRLDLPGDNGACTHQSLWKTASRCSMTSARLWRASPTCPLVHQRLLKARQALAFNPTGRRSLPAGCRVWARSTWSSPEPLGFIRTAAPDGSRRRPAASSDPGSDRQPLCFAAATMSSTAAPDGSSPGQWNPLKPLSTGHRAGPRLRCARGSRRARGDQSSATRRWLRDLLPDLDRWKRKVES